MVFKRILFFLFGIIGVLVILSYIPILKAELTQNSVNINNQYCCPNKKFLYVVLLKDRRVVIDDQNRLIVKLIFSKDGKIVYKDVVRSETLDPLLNGYSSALYYP